MSRILPCPPLVDSHCHLVFPAFASDLEAIIGRAAEHGVQRIVNPGTDLADSQAAVQLARQHEAVYAAVGVHPNHSADLPLDYPEQLQDLARQPRVVAIGEIGLDYYRNWAAPAQQIRVFKTQLDLALGLGLPVIIHCREALTDLLPILTDWAGSTAFSRSRLADRPYAGVLHAFGGDEAEARQAYRAGFLLGLGGPVTFRNARTLRRMVPSLDPERLLLETDAPFLSPHPFRGKRNEPSRISLVCESLAALYEVPAAQIAKVTTATACRFFGWTPLATR